MVTTSRNKTHEENGMDITAARARESVVCLDEAKSETVYCTLTPAQEAIKRREWSELRIQADAAADREIELKRQHKDAKAEFELTKSKEHAMSGSFVQSPPQGRFVFTGDRMIDEQSQTTWLEDAEGNPILETFRKMNSGEILERANQKKGEQLELDYEANQLEGEGSEEDSNSDDDALDDPDFDVELEGDDPEDGEGNSLDPDPDLM